MSLYACACVKGEGGCKVFQGIQIRNGGLKRNKVKLRFESLYVCTCVKGECCCKRFHDIEIRKGGLKRDKVKLRIRESICLCVCIGRGLL